MTWLLWLGLVLCLLAAAAVGLSAYGSKRWTHTTRTLANRLEAARIDEKFGRHPPRDSTLANSKACLRQCNVTSAQC
jgi:hypothetical protein